MRRLLAALCCAAAAAEPYGDPFDFFDKIYVVGVNESSGPARATAAALGLDIEVVDAVKPPERDGDFDAIRDQFTADALDDLSSGEIATSLSHRKALRAFLATTAETALGDLVRAYAADFACLRRFPGDERVRSQSSLLQAAARGGKAGFAHFKVFRYEALMANAAAPSNATGAKKRTERIEAVAGECLRAVAEDGDAGDAGGAPSEAALLAALEAAPDVLALLCATLAHDFVCLGYDFPPACAAFQARVDELPGDAPRFDGPARRGRTLLGRGDGKRVCLSQGVACGGPKDACYAEPKCRRKGDNPWARLKEASCDPQRPGYMCRGHSCWISVDCSVAKRAAATEAPEEDNCTCADYGL